MLTLFADAVDDATKIIGRVTSDTFHRQTPCSAWDLQQLLTHMIGEVDGFTEAVTSGGATPDRFLRDSVSAETMPAEWARSTAALRQAFSTADPDTIIELSVYGKLPVSVALAMQLLDTAVHSWDVARTLGSDYRPSEPTVKSINEFAHRIAARDEAGPAFRPAVAEPRGEPDPWDQALRLLGRNPDPSRAIS